MRIENWEVQDVWGSAGGAQWVIGNVYGNPLHEDGKMIHTSRITELDLANKTVKTMNSTYHLGAPRGSN